MNKLTDKDIIKALGYCVSHDECGADCPCFSGKLEMCGDREGLLKQCLDLINRQKAEIERLNNELVSADEVIGFREAEIERLQEVTTNTVNSSIRFGLDKEQEIRKAKSEAYKEFYERLQNMSEFLAEDDKYLGYSEAVRMNHIDNLYKELTEGGNKDG